MKSKIINSISFISLGLGVAGCASENPDNLLSSNRGYSFEATIENFGENGTRANRMDTEDLWTWNNFSKGDIVGFYSLYGNSDAPGGNGSFLNVPLTYGAAQSSSYSSFYNNDIDFNTDNFVRNTAFFYYPYRKNIDYDPAHTTYENDDYGFEIRDLKCEDGIERCNDLIWIFAPSSVTTNMSFSHAFTEIMILRGEGFTDAEDRTVRVVLDKGYSHAVIDDDPGSYMKYFRLVYLDGYEKTEEECRVWEAWDGKGKYTVEDKSNRYPYPSGYDDVTFLEKDIHYVILPTQRNLAKPSVEYIEICDDNGNWHKITNGLFYIYKDSKGNIIQTKTLERGQRYPLVIKMEENQAVVQPIMIEPWEETEEITETRAAGISTREEFLVWMTSYQSYLDNGRKSSDESLLEDFGDRTETANNEVRWTFYINDDLKDILSSGQYVINRLDDTIDGLGNTISNLSMTFTAPPAFIGEIGKNGKVLNLKFENINLTSTDNGTLTAGGICNVCSGEIENCTIDGSIYTSGPVGIIAGEAKSGASIKDCKCSGMIIGSSTIDNGLLGTKDQDVVLSGNNTSALLFQNLN